MSHKTATRPVRSWAALAQALVAAPIRWVVGPTSGHAGRIRRYANATAAPRRRAGAEPVLEGVSFFVPNLRFYVVLAAVFGIVLGGLTGGAVGIAFSGQAAAGSTLAPAPPARPVLIVGEGQMLEVEGLKLAVIASQATASAEAGLADVQITLAFARGLTNPEPRLWPRSGPWAVSAADFGVVTPTGQVLSPLTAMRDPNGQNQNWLTVSQDAGWLTLTARVPCWTPTLLEYDPLPFSGGARIQFDLPAASCVSG